MNRIRIPKKTETEVLFLSRHICCLCRDKNKDVQVHHIDEYNSNNEIENLAVLCLDCHSKVTGTRGLGKQYSPLEVKRYKREWENVVKVQFGMATFRKTQNIPKIEKQLFVYEIKRLIHEMIGIQDSHKSLLSKNFEILLSISILEGFEREVIDQLQHAFSLTAIAEKNKPIILAHYLPRFFGHLVGPIKVPLEKKTKRICLRQSKQSNSHITYQLNKIRVMRY